MTEGAQSSASWVEHHITSPCTGCPNLSFAPDLLLVMAVVKSSNMPFARIDLT